LPLAIYAALQLPGGDSAVWRLAALAVALSLAALVASEALTRASGQGRGSHVL
jgi:molybdate transport system permease protein